MCEYCKNIKKYEKNEDYLMEDGILYDEQDKRHWIVNNHGDFEDGIVVRFCPMCGRDLTEQENKVEMKPVIHAHAIIDWLGNCKCSNCGNIDLNHTEPYCQHCGSTLDEPEERED